MGKTTRNVDEEKRIVHPPGKPYLVYAHCDICKWKRYVWLCRADWETTWHQKRVKIRCDQCVANMSPEWVKRWLREHPEQNDTNTKL
jgi:hypothetical protein